MADDEVNPLGTPTTNYGWTKPTVGADVDVWGGYLNADLDGIDTTVKSVSNVANAAYPASNPSGYQTAANVTASLGSYLPLIGGTLSGNLIVGNGSGSAYLGFNTASGANYSAFSGQVLGVNRWNINLTGVPTETGSGNTGSDFNIIPYTDGGAQLASALSIKRSSGITTIANLSAPQAIGDNRIINGNFAVNQRGYVSNTALAAAAYGHDRWKAGASGCTYTFVSTLPDTTITIIANTLTQIIEAGMIEGGVYTLSWTGTAQARVYQGTPTGSYAASPIVTASLTAGTNTIIEFTNGSLTRVKLEIGSVATPYNRQSLAKSLADCQRYYQAAAVASYGGAVSGAVLNVPISLKVTMRATPTTTSNFTASSGLASPTVSPYSVDTLIISGTENATSYGAACTFTASAEL